MQLLPDKEQQAPLAWLLLAAAVFVVYVIGFKWYFDRRSELADTADALRNSEATYAGEIAQRDELEQAQIKVREFEADNDYFLTQVNESLASSALTTQLKAMISEHALNETDCRVMSNRPARQNQNEQLAGAKRIAINVQLRCNVDDLARVLFHIENAQPYLFVDNLNIQQRSTRRRQGREVVTENYLDVKFDLAGFIRA